MTESTWASYDFFNPLMRMAKIPMTTKCPICNIVYQTPNDLWDHPCPRCGWDGKWKQEVAPEDEITREIEHLSLRGCH